MVNILLSIIIYVLGIFTGIVIPIVVYKYCNFFNSKTIEKHDEQQPSDLKVNNVTADILSEWQTGKVVGDIDE